MPTPQEAVTVLRDLYERALTPEVTTELRRQETARFLPMKKDDLAAVAAGSGVILTKDTKRTKETIVKALGDRIIDRKGDYERAPR